MQIYSDAISPIQRGPLSEGGAKPTRREPRNKLQIYHDILSAIQEEMMSEGGAKPTRIQQLSNTSYDKFLRYLDELVSRDLVVKGDNLLITDRGRDFLREYVKIEEFADRFGLV